MGWYNDIIKEIWEQVKNKNIPLQKEIQKLFDFQKEYYNGYGDVIAGLHAIDRQKQKITKMARNEGYIS